MPQVFKTIACAFLIGVSFYLSGCLSGTNASSGEDFSLGPLLNIQRNEEEGYREINALGPFITYKKSDKTSEFGLRPLFYRVKNEERDLKELDFLYPFATYDKRDGDWRSQFLFYIFSFESNETEKDFQEKEFTLFPFVFSKAAKEEGNSYFALFPIYGRMKDKFLKDEINFFLFPLFLQTKRDGGVNNSYLWPFFGRYTGNQEGFRFWPFYGYRKVGTTPDEVAGGGGAPLLDEKFALWPVYVSKERVFYGERMKYFSIFPFYSDFDSPQLQQNTYLWPLFSHLEDSRKGIERWDTPWPFVNFTRGSKREDRVFPFYAKEVDGEDRQGFFLWPFYRYNAITLADHRRTRNTVLFYLYSDINEKPTVEGGRSGRRIDVWPFFSYKRDREGNRSFHTLSLLEPFLSGNEGIERNYSPFWRLYEWKKDKDGKTVSSFLWNTYRRESSEKGVKIDVRPIIPLFSYENRVGESKIDFLGGLLGYRSYPDKSTVKLFFFPIDISSDDKVNAKGVPRDE